MVEPGLLDRCVRAGCPSGRHGRHACLACEAEEVVWRKSSFSTGDHGECVEVAASSGGPVRFRESDEPAVVASAAPGSWGAFVRALKCGRLDG
ncbi:DUF397 domain-containing protein [Streptomyces sp. NPDC007100]|uniref:DUF397 domain-containing protein n=1 Tax=Streptomyces sp. NPDC007100 TaxID=3155602 RepID=UPI00340FBAA5